MEENFSVLKKYFGEDWIEKKIQEWLNQIQVFRINKEKIIFAFVQKVDELIKKFEFVEGFSEWVLDAKNSKDFQNFLFELLILETLLKKSEKFILKPKNFTTGRVLEASLERLGFFSYIEVTNLQGVPKNIQNEVNKLRKKSTQKFGGAQGIHFIGILKFYENALEFSSQIKLFRKLIEEKLKRFGSSTLTYVFTNIVAFYNPNLNKIFWGKSFELIPNLNNLKKIPKNFFEDIFEFNEHKII